MPVFILIFFIIISCFSYGSIMFRLRESIHFSCLTVSFLFITSRSLVESAPAMTIQPARFQSLFIYFYLSSVLYPKLTCKLHSLGGVIFGDEAYLAG